jgi:predicted Zn-dependent peptidase
MKHIKLFIFFLVSASTVWAQNPDRSAPPALSTVKDLQLPPIQRFELSNGVKVVLMEKHSVPLVQVNLLIRAGSVHDPQGKEGLASFTMDMLDEGAGKFDALQLADEIEFLGTEIRTFSGPFSSGVNCLAPLARLEPSLSLMADVALRPKFETKDFERLQKLKLNGLLQNYDQPTVIASRAFSKFLFDPKSPYARFTGESSLRSITPADLSAFHKSIMARENCTLVVVGDVTADAIKSMLEKHFGSIPSGTPTASIPVPTSPVKKRVIYLIDKPGAAQSVIRIGRMAGSRGDKDYYSATVMNTILGGSFASRLNSNLREAHGYSYGAGSFFYFWPVSSPFVASSSVQTDVTGPALKEFFNEFNAMRKPLPKADLDRGRNYEALGYAANFETTASIADALADLVFFNLPDTYFNSYINNILGVPQAGAEAAAKKYVTPENMLVVVVGDRAKVEKGIRDLNLGTLTILSVEDVLGKKPVLE